MMNTLILRVKRTTIEAVATHSVCELWRGAVCVFRGYGIEHTPVAMAAGEYAAGITVSPRFSKAAGHPVQTWELRGVYDGARLRQGIRIHAANRAEQLDGCLSLGMSQVDIDGDGDLDVGQSRRAIQLFEQAAGKDEQMQVVITDP